MSKRYRIYKSPETKGFPWRIKAEDCNIEYVHNYFICGKGCDGSASWQSAVNWLMNK